MRLVRSVRIVAFGLVLGAGLGLPPKAWGVFGGTADFVCLSPTDARDDLVSEVSLTDTSEFGEKECNRYCSNLHKSCKALAKARASCHKALIKRDAAAERIVCRLEEDKEFRADCNQSLKEDVRDCRTSLKEDASAAKEDCAALEDTCRTDCAAGTLFP